MVGELAIINIIFLNVLCLFLVRSWSHILVLVGAEVLWTLLVNMLLYYAPFLFELSFFCVAIICLIVSGVELVIGLLLFIIYYHVTNYLSTGTLGVKPLRFYTREFSKLKLFSPHL